MSCKHSSIARDKQELLADPSKYWVLRIYNDHLLHIEIAIVAELVESLLMMMIIAWVEETKLLYFLFD